MNSNNSPARVAKVGQRIPAAEPLPPGIWRDAIRGAIQAVLIVLALLLTAFAVTTVLR